MRSSVRFLLPVALLLAAQSLSAQVLPFPRGEDPKDRRRELNATSLRGVNESIGEWLEAWSRDDARAVARLYTENAALLTDGGEMLRGRGAIQAHMDSLLGGVGELQVSIDDFTSSGQIAYAMGRFAYNDEAEAAIRPVAGTYVMVFHRDGRDWKIRAQSFLPEAVPGA